MFSPQLEWFQTALLSGVGGERALLRRTCFTSRRVCWDRACVQQQSASLASTALDFYPSTGCFSVYGVASLLDERHLPHD